MREEHTRAFDDSCVFCHWSCALGMITESPDEMEEDSLPQNVSLKNMRVSVNNVSSNQLNLSDRVCKVCGDRAVGYNFGVISCESCKAFFRRNAYREEEIRCPFSSSCEINKNSRRFCQSCRLQKCIKIGMKRDSGWSEKTSTSTQQQSQVRKRHYKTCLTPATPLNEMDNIEINDEGAVTMPKHVFDNLVRKAQNTSDKQRECTCTCTCSFYPPDTRLTAKEEIQNPPSVTSTESLSVPQPSYKLPEENVMFYPISSTYAPPPPKQIPSNASHMLSLLESPLNSCATNFIHNGRLPPTGGSYSGSWYTNVPFQDTNQYMMDITGMTSQRSPVSLNPQPNILNQYNTFPLVGRDDYRPIVAAAGNDWSLLNSMTSLSADDRALMSELVSANLILKAPMDVGLNNRSDGALSLLDVVRISQLAMRRIISMAKDLHLFSSQQKCDQIAILKGSLSELLILRGVMVFDPTQDTWRHQVFQGSKEIQLTVDVLKQTPEHQHYAEHKKFLASFDDKWRRNESVMLILNAITLFCPSRPNIVDVAKVRECQQRYYALLKRYLNTQCSEVESQQVYTFLLQKLEDLRMLNQSLLRIYSHVNPNDLDPLLQELFDLNPTR